jgi:diguanylate cyclase (GGDEF)-like protein
LSRPNRQAGRPGGTSHEVGLSGPFPDSISALLRQELAPVLAGTARALEAAEAALQLLPHGDPLRIAFPEGRPEDDVERELSALCLAEGRSMLADSAGRRPAPPIRELPAVTSVAVPLRPPEPPVFPLPSPGSHPGEPFGVLYLRWTRRRPAARKQNALLETLISQLERTAAGAIRYVASITDTLTGALARKHFEEMLHVQLQALTRNQAGRAALLMIDIDGLQEINDSAGFAAGDEVIAAVAARIHSSLGDRGFLCRFGGAKFSVFLRDAGRAEAAARAKRILKAVRRLSFSTLPAPPGAAIGIALTPDHGSSPEELLRNADRALYAGKKSGKGRVELYRARTDSGGWSARRLAALVTGDQTADHRNIQILLDTMSTVTFQSGLQEVATTLLKASLALTGAERALLLLYDGEGLRFKAGMDARGRLLRHDIRFSRSIPERVASSGESICLKDTSLSREGRRKSIQELALRSVMCIPLKAADRVVGALYVDSPTRLAAFSEADLAFFEAIAGRCAPAVENARLGEILKEENRLLRKSSVAYGKSPIIGFSPAILKILERVPELAFSSSPLLITGESGTGKELLARAIHEAGPRKARPFVPQNCAAIPPDLLESELFGFARGAFSGATRDKKGLFELAQGGTFLLDEIGDMNPLLQAKLLRILEEKKVRRIGETEPVDVDFRLISATHRNLDASVAAGEFRADLLYRINVLAVHIPPLRERREDIPLLVRHFLKLHEREKNLKVPAVPRKTMDYLCSLELPGNARQLSGIVEKGMMLANGGAMTLEHLGAPPGRVPAGKKLKAAKESLEKEMIRKALETAKGNLTAAAGTLGIRRQQLQRLVRKYRIHASGRA